MHRTLGPAAPEHEVASPASIADRSRSLPPGRVTSTRLNNPYEVSMARLKSLSIVMTLGLAGVLTISLTAQAGPFRGHADLSGYQENPTSQVQPVAQPTFRSAGTDSRCLTP
jgi:hypothetical protein